jgi:hypothetical protein
MRRRQAMSKRELKKQQERATKHGCDGRCYWETGMCPAVEVCEETRAGEFMATVIGGIMVLLMMAVPPILLAGGAIALIWAIIQTVLAI